MPTTQEGERSAGKGEQERRSLHAVIGKRVMQTLGQPETLHSVAVRALWGDRYRVNVFVGADAGCAKVAHSYFVVADGDGNVLVSSPQITKQY